MWCGFGGRSVVALTDVVWVWWPLSGGRSVVALTDVV